MVNYSSDGALGLGLLDNFYNTKLKAKNYEFFEDFDDNNKPINEFLITLNEVFYFNFRKKKIINSLLVMMKLQVLKTIVPSNGSMFLKIYKIKTFGIFL
tara:strand:+ start:569 stop:865 length:297 start_codon:yes stop_codon:yes gene_type:complete